MTERGWTPRKDQRPTRWPPSADSSRNDGPEPRSFRYAETGVSVSAMKVWRSGTSECSAANARASSRLGRISTESAATGIQHLVGVREHQVARGQQDSQVVEHVRGLFRDPLVGLLARRARDLLGLLLNLVADERRIGEELLRIAALAGVRAAVADDPLERRQRLVRCRFRLALEEAA